MTIEHQSLSGRTVPPDGHVDFLFFVVFGKKWNDFVAPLVPALSRLGYTVRVCMPGDEMPVAATVFVSTNESTPFVRLFPAKKKVLLGHSLFVGDPTVPPLKLAHMEDVEDIHLQNAVNFLSYDYYFCPSVYYRNHLVSAIADLFHYDHENLQAQEHRRRVLIAGGYVKNFRSKGALPVGQAGGGAARHVLYAPSANASGLPDDSFSYPAMGMEILQRLSACLPAANIICRPHPGEHTSKVTREMVEALRACGNVVFDLGGPHAAMYSSPDVLITDVSGFALVFALSTRRRPVFFIRTGFDELRYVNFVGVARRFGRVAFDLDALAETVQAQLEQPDYLSDQEYGFLQRVMFDTWNTVEQAVDDLVAIFHDRSAPHWETVTPVPAMTGREEEGVRLPGDRALLTTDVEETIATGAALVDDDKRLQAVEYLAPVLACHPQHPGLLAQYGVALMKIGFQVEACRYFEEAMRLDPGCGDEVHENLDMCIRLRLVKFLERIERLEAADRMADLEELARTAPLGVWGMWAGTSRLLAKARLRPACLVALRLNAEGQRDVTAALAISLGSVVYDDLSVDSGGWLEVLQLLMNELSADQENTIFNRMLVTNVPPLLSAALARKDGGQVQQLLAIVHVAAPRLRGLFAQSAVPLSGERPSKLSRRHRDLARLVLHSLQKQ
ncbi:MAG: hypothetical protein H7838_06345 [Magnetococcus sp. DMHC-8]